MGQYKYLLKVEPGENNNKYYKMSENTDGTFTATYGRVGAAKPATEIYPMDKWDSKLKEKLSARKGYKDQTELFAEVKAIVGDSGNVIADDKTIVSLIVMLQGYAKANTAKTYLVQAESVTKAQIDQAQKHIDVLVSLYQDHFGKATFSFQRFNKELVDLFTTIPRKMREVGEELLYEHKGYFDRALGVKKYIPDTKKTIIELKAEIEKLIETEQSNLDTMASQVATTIAPDPAVVTKNKTLIESLGLKISLLEDKKEMDKVRKLAENHAHRVLKVFTVTNNATQTAFNNHLDKAANKKVELFWHGSRNQNWWWIIQQGLKIRPSNAVYSGSMFGDGMYFASESDKSMGYTDNGRWVNGRANERVFMALYNVHVGKQYETNYSDSSLSESKIKKLGCDSTWGKKGPSLHRHEYIIYNSNQSTIQYLVEFSV